MDSRVTAKADFRTFVKVFKLKDDTRHKFASGSYRGDYLPKELGADQSTFYSIRLVGTQYPLEDGRYIVTGDQCWIDKREGYAEKHIVRVKGNITVTKEN